MYCPRPYEQFYVTSKGDVHLCCPEWVALPAGNLFESHPIEIWTGENARMIREGITDQSFRHCTNCPLLPGPAGCVRDVPPEQPDTRRIRTLTIAYDPTCNLTCPSCRTSVKGKDPLSAKIQEILLDSGIFNLVDRVCSSGSGDPLAAPLYWELLERLPPAKYPHLKLALQTNGVLLTEKTWERLGENAARIDEILVSVDACGPETYAKNRRGGDWDVLMENLAGIKARGIPLQMSMVVQQNNFREMPGFVDLARRFGARTVYFSALENWGTYRHDDYSSRAVHLRGHPEHAELLRVLGHPHFKDLTSITLARLPRP